MRRATSFVCALWGLWACSYEPLTIAGPYLTGRVEVDRTTEIRANGVDGVRVVVRVFDSRGTPLERSVRLLLPDHARAASRTLVSTQGIAEGLVSSERPGEMEIGAEIITDAGAFALPERYTVTFVADAPRPIAFAPPATYDVGVQPYGLVTARLNRDGVDDLVVGSWGEASLDLFVGQRGGLAHHASRIGLSASPRALLADGPLGATHLYVAHPSDDRLTLVAFEGLEVRATRTAETRATPRALCLADLDGDGDQDVVVASANAKSVTVFLVDRGTLTPLAHVGAGLTPSALAAGDFDADGDLDVAVADPTGGAVLLLLNDGTGALSQGDTLPLTLATALVRLDANDDGLDDLAAATGPAGTLQVFLQEDASLVARHALTLGGNLSAIASADLDRDGRAELMTTDTATSNLYIVGSGDDGWAIVTSLFTATGPIALASGDWNYDGYPDLATANADAGSITVFYGK